MPVPANSNLHFPRAMADDSQQRPVRVCLTRCPLPAAGESVHSLPCHIHHDGPAPIKSYFQPEEASQDERKDGKKEWRAEFRGVQLAGTRVSLQDFGMQGLVLEDAGLTHEEDEGRIWEVDSHFSEFTFWYGHQERSVDTIVTSDWVDRVSRRAQAGAERRGRGHRSADDAGAMDRARPRAENSFRAAWGSPASGAVFNVAHVLTTDDAFFEQLHDDA